MSDILNHYFCGREALDLINDNKLKDNIIKYYDAYRLGTQGPDFFYYNIFDKNLKKSVEIARSIHNKEIDKFFYYGLKFANKYPDYRDITLAYLSGFVTHHSLDVKTHPFIYFRTDYLENPKPNELKYNHKLYEVLLDTAMTQYEYSKQAVYENPEKVFIVTKETMKFLEKFYSYILKKVYDINVNKNLVKNSLKSAAQLISLTKDPFNYKNRIFSFLEKRLGIKHILTRMFYPMYTNEFLILNIEKLPWLDPVTGEIHNESYPELFHQAVEEATNNIIALDKLADNEENSLNEFNELFGNRSYLTGKNADEDQERKYFDKSFNKILAEYF